MRSTAARARASAVLCSARRSRFLDADLVIASECCAAEPAEHNSFFVDDKTGVRAGGAYARSNAVGFDLAIG
jgi:hypothetical protein